jgi:hypothetical protein
MPQSEDICCKVGRVASERGLSGIDEWLIEEWQNGTSVRSLTERLNKDLIESELTSVNAVRLELSNIPVYESLHTDELDEPEAIEIKRELERTGVNVESLVSDLVSPQTVYRHLTNCISASGPEEKTVEERQEKARIPFMHSSSGLS